MLYFHEKRLLTRKTCAFCDVQAIRTIGFFGSSLQHSFSHCFKTAVVSLAALATACATPVEHQVRLGADPRYSDTDVAFRTVYYFRVFDYCANQERAKEQGDKFKGVPYLDSLYRFRMTGKADTLTNAIKFESGTLRSWELDPLGSKVVYDENIDEFRYRSKEELTQKAQRAQAWADYRKLRDEYEALVKRVEGQSKGDNARPAKYDDAISRILSEINKLDSDLMDQTAKANHDSANAIKPAGVRTPGVLSTTIANEIDELDDVYKDFKGQVIKDVLTASSDADQAAMTEIKGALKAEFIAESTKTVKAFKEDLYEKVKTKVDAQSTWPLPAGNKDTIIEGFIAAADVDSAATKISIADNSVVQDRFYARLMLKSPSNSDRDGAVDKLLDKYIAALLANVSHKQGTPAVSVVALALENEFKKLDDATKENFLTGVKSTIDGYDISPKSGLVGADVFEDSFQTIAGDSNLETDFRKAGAPVLQAAVAIGVETAMEAATFPSIRSGEQELLKTLRTAMNAKLRQATNTAVDASIPVRVKGARVADSSVIDCNSNNIRERRGFQILGPEGWRTFDPDERLVLAMHKSSKPLLSSLQSLSNRVVTAHEQSAKDPAGILEARLELSETRRKFDRKAAAVDDIPELKALVDELIKELGVTAENDN